jgi:hypothetical protein
MIPLAFACSTGFGGDVVVQFQFSKGAVQGAWWKLPQLFSRARRSMHGTSVKTWWTAFYRGDDAARRIEDLSI